MSIKIRLLEAGQGDSIILTYGEKEKNNILIDGGIGRRCLSQLKEFVQQLQGAEQKINLMVLTHTDSDHIQGFLKLLGDSNFDFQIIERMWFNYGQTLCRELEVKPENEIKISIGEDSTQITMQQGKELEEIVEKKIFWEPRIIKAGDSYQIGEAKFWILSPTIQTLREFNTRWEMEIEGDTRIAAKNDYGESVECLNNKEENKSSITLANRSSIAFLYEYKKSKILFLGDAAAGDIIEALEGLGYSEDKPIDVNYCKIAHHASKHNTTNQLVKMINCNKYIISTCMTATGRPSKECLSRIICNTHTPVTFYCNYPIDYKRIFTEEELEKYKVKFEVMDREGIDVEEEE